MWDGGALFVPGPAGQRRADAREHVRSRRSSGPAEARPAPPLRRHLRRGPPPFDSAGRLQRTLHRGWGSDASGAGLTVQFGVRVTGVGQAQQAPEQARALQERLSREVRQHNVLHRCQRQPHRLPRPAAAALRRRRCITPSQMHYYAAAHHFGVAHPSRAARTSGRTWRRATRATHGTVAAVPPRGGVSTVLRGVRMGCRDDPLACWYRPPSISAQRPGCSSR